MSYRFLSPLLSAFLLLPAFTTFALSSDSLVQLREITYNSSFEKQAFEEYFTGDKKNYLALFMAVSKKTGSSEFSTAHQAYQETLKQLNTGDLQKKNEAKKVKNIYNQTHERLLSKYELKNHFHEIFENGNFNCVSASALYGLLFDDMHIPYTIKESPTHVYLIAYPQTHKILIESTDPRQGYMVFDDKFKTSFVSNLRSGKLISEQEYKSESTNVLFDKYYFSEENITIKELIGIQYMNDALYKLQDGQLEEAFIQLEKAYLFYPCKKAAYLLLSTAALILDKKNYTTIEDASYLIKLARYKEYGISNDHIIAEFHRITQLHLVNNNRQELYDKFYEKISMAIANKELTQEICYIYHYERSRILYNQGRYQQALSFAEKTYVLKPENTDVQTLFVSALGNSLKSQSGGAKVLEILSTYEQRFPDLVSNHIFYSYLIQACLISCGQQYELKKILEAEKLRARFENLYGERGKDIVDSYLISRVYSTGAMHYFRAGNEAKAKAILMKGLELAPNDYDMQRRLQILKQ
jgi:tetratricopeptide (TPR) repeat protein